MSSYAKNITLFFFKETWLVKQNLCILNQISEYHLANGTYQIDYENGLIRGRPSGGTAVLWHKNLPAAVLKNCDDTKIDSK